MSAPDLTFWRTRHGTRHFDFEAFGRTEGEALANLKRGLEAHAANGDVFPDGDLEPGEDDKAAWVREQMDDKAAWSFQIGASYRDDNLLTEPGA